MKITLNLSPGFAKEIEDSFYDKAQGDPAPRWRELYEKFRAARSKAIQHRKDKNHEVSKT